MPAFPQGFSARTVAPMGSGSQLPVSPPEGWPVIITGSEVQATQSDPNSGKLTLNIMVIDGDHKGVVGDDNLNLFHTNPKTCEIAAQQLSSYCWAVNQPDATMAEQLYNIPFRVIVTQNKKDEKYVDVRPLCADGSKPGKAGGPAPVAAPVPTSTPSAPAFVPPAAVVAPPASTTPPWGTPTGGTAAAPPWGAPQ